MLNEKEIKELLKGSLREYIKRLEMSDLHYAEHGAEAKAYLKVLKIECKYLDIDKAKKLLDEM